MPTEYSAAPDVEKVARQLINRYHTHLATARIDYVLIVKRDKDGNPQPVESKGKQLWGRARKVTGLNAFLSRKQGSEGAEDYFVIEIDAFVWGRINAKVREALVDHELCHCTYDGDMDKPSIRSHDVEEFGEVIRRHGLWRPEVESFVRIGAEQMKLGFEPPTASAKAEATRAPAHH